jgi:type II secretory pathway pseudopilin PulG
MSGAKRFSSGSAPGQTRRGFSLVELMVALTGGLFVSVIVFAMARQGTRFYQQETRVAEATLASTIGMQRLRADIGRAGYMSSAYIGAGASNDPNLCMNYAGSPVSLLGNMRSVQIIETNVDSSIDPGKSGIAPDIIQLSGAYQNSDRFIAGYLQMNAGLLAVPLQPNIGALARLRYLQITQTADKQALLTSLFPTGRLLRLVNQYGRVAYGLINSTNPTGDPTNALPTILLEAAPAIPLQGAANAACVFSGVGVEVNVVNFIRYRIASLKNYTTYSGSYGQLFASTLANSNPADAYRTELIREELNPADGSPFANTPPDIVAEYAIDLKFEGLVTPGTGPNQPTLAMTPGAGDIYAITTNTATGQPQRVRSLRARLSVRSREADRTSNVPAALAAKGRYRIAVGAAQPSFARVRTVQTDIAIPNHYF